MIFENTDQSSNDENFDIERHGGEIQVENIAIENNESCNSFSEEKNNKRVEQKIKEDIINTDVKKHFVLSKTDLMLARRLIRNIKENNEKLSQIFHDLPEEVVNITENERNAVVRNTDQSNFKENIEQQTVDIECGVQDDSGVIEGFFDGIGMMGPDGKQYSVPYNYSSKSKLVDGDILKLTITPRGNFVYKQIQPTERVRVVTTLDQDVDGNFSVTSGEKKWKVLLASVSYFRGEPGDEAIVLVPRDKESKWAAIENIIKK